MLTSACRAVRRKFAESVVAKGSVFILVVRIYGAVLAIIAQMYMARTMGAEQLGIYVFALSWLTILGCLTPIGFDTALVRYIASFSSEENWGKVRGVLSVGFSSTFAVSVTAAIVGLVFILLTGDLSAPYSDALMIAFATIPLLALINLHNGIARGFRWVYQVSMPSYALRPTLFLMFIVGAVEFGLPLNNTQAMSSTAAACLLTWLYVLWRYRKSLPSETSSASPERQTRIWLHSALPMVVAVSFDQLIINTDLMMLGILEGPQATGVYNIALRLAVSGQFFMYAVAGFAAPKIAELFNQENRPELIRFFGRVRIAIAVPTLAMLAGLTIVGQPLLTLFGSEFPDAYIPMIILCAAISIRAIAGPVRFLLIMTGKHGEYAKLLGVVAAINLVSNGILIPIYGVIGAAIATTGSTFIEITLTSYIGGRHIGFRPWLPSSWHWSEPDR